MEHRVVDLMADHAAVGRAPFLRSLDRVAVPGKLGHHPIPGNRKPRPIDMLGMSSPCRSPARKCRGPMGVLTC